MNPTDRAASVSGVSAIRLLNDTGNDYHYERTGTAINEEQGMRSGAVNERIVRRAGGRRRLTRVALLAAGAAVTASALSACSIGASAAGADPRKIVGGGAENEYADVISQVGGQYVQVSAIMSNPNTDPHTFEASPAVA